jgi:hypothetical protein
MAMLMSLAYQNKQKIDRKQQQILENKIPLKQIYQEELLNKFLIIF